MIKKHLEKNSHWLEIQEILKKISQEGFQVFIVGGAVRDALLNRKLKEIDLVSSAKPDDILRLFPKARGPFKKYGVIFISLKDGTRLEITSFRKDSSKSDGRRPEFIEYASMDTDFMRRDFTINALYYDPQKDKIFDFSGGQKDLKEKKIKTIGKAKERFREDYLRMIRALRFESQLGFKLDPEVTKAIKEQKQKLKEISPERITEEIHKVFLFGKTLSFISSLKKHGLFDLIFPNLDFNKTKSYLSFFDPISSTSLDVETKERKNSRDPLDTKSSQTKKQISYHIVLSWISLGLASFYGSKKNFQDFLKRYLLASRMQKEILSYLDSIEVLVKKEAKEEQDMVEKWLAFNGRADLVYKLSKTLLLHSKAYSSSLKLKKYDRKEYENKCNEKVSKINITEKQLQAYFVGFQKRAKAGRLPSPLLRGSDLLNRKPAIKKEDFSKILKKSYHIQLINPQLTKEDILKQMIAFISLY